MSAPDGVPDRRRTTWLLLAAAALNGLVYLLLLAPWMGEDEPWHMEYASHVADGYLAITEIGEPMRPRLYSEHWKRLCRKAKVRELTLHEARHSSVSLMRSKGISDQVIAAYHGHDEQTMRRTYSHLMPGDLEGVADVL